MRCRSRWAGWNVGPNFDVDIGKVEYDDKSTEYGDIVECKETELNKIAPRVVRVG